MISGAKVRRTLGALAVVGLLVTGVAAGGARAGAADRASDGTPAPHGIFKDAAQLTGPITEGYAIEPLSVHPTGLAANGYMEQEYFASGTASAFTATSAPANGRWSIAPTTSAFYRTRILVRRPIDPSPLQRHRGRRVDERLRR